MNILARAEQIAASSVYAAGPAVNCAGRENPERSSKDEMRIREASSPGSAPRGRGTGRVESRVA